jgi:hypothetical protein
MEGEMDGQQMEGDMEQVQQQPTHYYDSIDTDEFVMPNRFEVEIRLADNQVSFIYQRF